MLRKCWDQFGSRWWPRDGGQWQDSKKSMVGVKPTYMIHEGKENEEGMMISKFFRESNSGIKVRRL